MNNIKELMHNLEDKGFKEEKIEILKAKTYREGFNAGVREMYNMTLCAKEIEPKWIKKEDRLPKEDIKVMKEYPCIFKNGDIKAVRSYLFENGHFKSVGQQIVDEYIVAWYDLPDYVEG